MFVPGHHTSGRKSNVCVREKELVKQRIPTDCKGDLERSGSEAIDRGSTMASVVRGPGDCNGLLETVSMPSCRERLGAGKVNE